MPAFSFVTTTLWYPQTWMKLLTRISSEKILHILLKIELKKKRNVFLRSFEFIKLQRRVMTNKELHDSGFHFEEIFPAQTFSLKIENALPNLFLQPLLQSNKILQDISLLLNSTFFKIGAHEPRWAAYLERFWFLLIKVGQGRRSSRSRSFFSHLRNRCRQRMQYLGAPHNISFCGKVSDEKVKKKRQTRKR